MTSNFPKKEELLSSGGMTWDSMLHTAGSVSQLLTASTSFQRVLQGIPLTIDTIYGFLYEMESLGMTPKDFDDMRRMDDDTKKLVPYIRTSNLEIISLTRLISAVGARSIVFHGIRFNITADFRWVNFEWADLSWITFRFVHMESAIFDGADLRKANLSSANLKRASLKNADLREAKLHCTVLGWAILDGADLRGAYIIDPITGDKISITPEYLQEQGVSSFKDAQFSPNPK